jgi:hypothetical protein
MFLALLRLNGLLLVCEKFLRAKRMLYPAAQPSVKNEHCPLNKRVHMQRNGCVPWWERMPPLAVKKQDTAEEEQSKLRSARLLKSGNTEGPKRDLKLADPPHTWTWRSSDSSIDQQSVAKYCTYLFLAQALGNLGGPPI